MTADRDNASEDIAQAHLTCPPDAYPGTIDDLLDNIPGNPFSPATLATMPRRTVGHGNNEHFSFTLMRRSAKVLCDSQGVLPRYNLMTKQVELVWPILDDIAARSFDKPQTVDIETKLQLLFDTAQMMAQALGGVLPDKIRAWADAILLLARGNPYSPAENWLEGLPVAEPGGIKQLADLVTLTNEEHRPLFEKCLRMWMIQAVQAAVGWREPEAIEHVLTLVSTKQGIGKTQFVANLAPDTLVGLGVKLPGAGQGGHSSDAVIAATFRWLCEIGEMSRSLVAGQTDQKAHLSNKWDTFRAPYARGHTTTPRNTAYLGTADKLSLFKDRAGNRRFMPFVVEAIEYTKVAGVRNAAWSEALQAWDAGEDFRPDSVTAEALAKLAELHDVSSSEEDALEELYGGYVGMTRREANAHHAEQPQEMMPMQVTEVMDVIHAHMKAGRMTDHSRTALREIVTTWLDRHLHTRFDYRRPAALEGHDDVPERRIKSWMLPTQRVAPGSGKPAWLRRLHKWKVEE